MTLTGATERILVSGKEVEIPKHVELERDLESRERESERPIADNYLIQELAEKEDIEDGKYLHCLLELLGVEIESLMLTDRGQAQRSLAMCLTKVQEARMWALRHMEEKNGLLILDRRRFKLKEVEEDNDGTKGDE